MFGSFSKGAKLSGQIANPATVLTPLEHGGLREEPAAAWPITLFIGRRWDHESEVFPKLHSYWWSQSASSTSSPGPAHTLKQPRLVLTHMCESGWNHGTFSFRPQTSDPDSAGPTALLNTWCRELSGEWVQAAVRVCMHLSYREFCNWQCDWMCCWSDWYWEGLLPCGQGKETKLACGRGTVFRRQGWWGWGSSVKLSFLPNLFVPQSPHFSYVVIIIARVPQRVVVQNGADTCKEWCAHLSACSASVSPQWWQVQGHGESPCYCMGQTA